MTYLSDRRLLLLRLEIVPLSDVRVLPVQLQTLVLLGFDPNLFAEEAQELRCELC